MVMLLSTNTSSMPRPGRANRSPGAGVQSRPASRSRVANSSDITTPWCPGGARVRSRRVRSEETVGTVMVDPRQLRVHASHLDAVRARFAAVRAASQKIARDQGAFGPLCGWIFTGLGDRHARQDELIAYVEENLFIAADGLRRIAAGHGDLTELSSGDGDDSDIDAATTPWETRRSGSEVAERVIEAVQSREWVDDLLAGAAPVVEFAAPATDSFTALRAGSLDWALAYIPSLRRMLDDLTGMPELVAAHAATWRTIATDLHRIGADLWSCLDRDLSGWPWPEVR